MEQVLMILGGLGLGAVVLHLFRKDRRLAKTLKENALLRAEKELAGTLSDRAEQEEDLEDAKLTRIEAVRRYRDLSGGHDPESSDL